MLKFLVFLFLLAPPVSANVVGSDAQNFNPTTSGLDFVTVHSSETLEPGIFNLGLFVNYAKNAFPYYQPAGATVHQKRETALVGADLNVGLGFMKNWDGGISFPLILAQQIDDDASVGHYSNTGNTEIRFNTKLRLFGNARNGLGLITSANFNRIANNPYVGKGGGPIFNLETAGDATIGRTALALNVGYRWRKAGERIADSGIEPIPNQWLASGAISYLVEAIDSKIIFEVLAAIPEKNKLQSATDREYSVTEGLIGLKYESKSNLAVHIGGGAGLLNGVSSPDWRVYTGLNFSFGPLSGRHSATSDPYASRRRRRQRPVQPKLVEKPAPRSEPSPATPVPAPAAPSPAPVAEVPTAIDDIGPARTTETIREVKVFDRGNFNHIVLKNIEFVPGTKTLKPESEVYFKTELIPALNELNRRRPIGTIIVEGHTDSLGDAADNLKLSAARASAVANLLEQHLPLKVQVQPIGMGAGDPIADNGNYQGRALNRRVEIKVLYRKSSR